MTYSIEAARAERAAARTTEPFRFEFDDRTWTMKHIDDVPSGWLTWSAVDYAEKLPDMIVEEGFPVERLTVGDMNALVAAWLGATPGE